MSDQQDDTVPNEEPTQETQPAAESSPAEETIDPSISEDQAGDSPTVEEPADDPVGDEPTVDAEEGSEIDREEYIPVSRHKKILEKARLDAAKKESKGEAQIPADEQEGEEVELTAPAQALIDQRVREGVEATLQEKEKAAEEERKTQVFNAEVSRLSKEHDGKDGLPKFEPKKVMEHGRKVGIYNLQASYEHMNAKAIEENIRKKVAKEYAENPPASSDRPGSSGGGRETTPKTNERVDMRDRSQITARIRKARLEIEAGQS